MMEIEGYIFIKEVETQQLKDGRLVIFFNKADVLEKRKPIQPINRLI